MKCSDCGRELGDEYLISHWKTTRKNRNGTISHLVRAKFVAADGGVKIRQKAFGADYEGASMWLWSVGKRARWREKRRLMSAVWHEEHREYVNERERIKIEGLSDGYVRYHVRKSTGLSLEDITPEIIEERRELIKLNRKLRELKGRPDYGKA